MVRAQQHGSQHRVSARSGRHAALIRWVLRPERCRTRRRVSCRPSPTRADACLAAISETTQVPIWAGAVMRRPSRGQRTCGQVILALTEWKVPRRGSYVKLRETAPLSTRASTMSRSAWLLLSILLLCTAGFLLSLNGCGGGSTPPPPPPPASKIQHVVIIFQENRTPDNLFQGLCIPPYGNPSSCNSINPTASQYDIATSGTDSTGANVTLLPIDRVTAATNGNPDNYDLSHAHSAFVRMCDLNPATGAYAMDGADLIAYNCTPTTPPTVNCPPPKDPQFMYVYPSDVQAYLTMAQTYTFADHMLQTNEGPKIGRAS